LRFDVSILIEKRKSPTPRKTPVTWCVEYGS